VLRPYPRRGVTVRLLSNHRGGPELQSEKYRFLRVAWVVRQAVELENKYTSPSR